MNFSSQSAPLRVGIVGSGIAGLSAAWSLQRRGCQVTLFERQPLLGMDAYSISYDSSGQQFHCDVPPRMFNQSLWPKLFQLYQDAGVEIVPVEPSKTFCPWLRPNANASDNSPKSAVGKPWLKLGDSYLPAITPALLLHSSSRRILKDIGRMMLRAEQDRDRCGDVSFQAYLAQRQYSRDFIEQFLYPSLSSTVCTCSYQALDNYPASVLLDAMIRLVKPEGLFRTRYGTQDVVQRLVENVDVRLNSAVDAVIATATVAEPLGANGRLGEATRSAAIVALESGEQLPFDHVIVATQANAALVLVQNISNEEADLLSAFRYENVPVAVHRDLKHMPPSPSDWSTFNLICDGHERAMCTIWLNRFYPDWPADDHLFQTIMPIENPALDSIVATGRMQRPVVTPTSLAAVSRIHELQSDRARGDRRVWFCGSYLSSGIPLLESGVDSSQRVVDRIVAGHKTGSPECATADFENANSNQ